MNRSILNGINEGGVSETIAGVLLIGLTVVGVALISVFFFSQPMEEEIPVVDVLVSNVGTTILFQHNGGDSLGMEDFTIYVEGNAVDASELTIMSPGDWPWSVGETIQYTAAGTVAPLDENVRIAYREDKGILLRPSFVDDAGTNTNLADVAFEPLPTLSPGVVPATPSPEEAGVIVAESVLADSDIIAAFTTLEKDGTIQGKYLNFTIASPNSTMNFVGTGNFNLHRDLDNGDTISIRTGPQQNGNRISITGVGNTFFGLSFESVFVCINGTQINGEKEVEIKSAWIPKYNDLESTLAFKLGGPNKLYELYIDGVPDSRGSTGEEITLTNVRPTDSGMFVINTWSSNDDSNSVILAKAEIS